MKTIARNQLHGRLVSNHLPDRPFRGRASGDDDVLCSPKGEPGYRRASGVPRQVRKRESLYPPRGKAIPLSRSDKA